MVGRVDYVRAQLVGSHSSQSYDFRHTPGLRGDTAEATEAAEKKTIGMRSEFSFHPNVRSSSAASADSAVN